MGNYDHLETGRLYWHDGLILTGKIQWLYSKGGNPTALWLHTDPITQDQINQIGTAHLDLKLTFVDGKASGLEEGTMRAEGGQHVGDTRIFIECTNPDGWPLDI